MDTFFEDSLNEALLQGKVQVKFTKADGSERIMICSKNPSYVPADQVPNMSGEPAPVQHDLFKVFDIEQNSWRSFKPSRVIEYNRIDA